MRESDIEKKIVSKAKGAGWMTFKLNGPGDKGKPDRVFLAPGGRTVFIEFKAFGGRVSPLQKRCLAQLTSMGFECYVVDNVDGCWELFDAK